MDSVTYLLLNKSQKSITNSILCKPYTHTDSLFLTHTHRGTHILVFVVSWGPENELEGNQGISSEVQRKTPLSSRCTALKKKKIKKHLAGVKICFITSTT